MAADVALIADAWLKCAADSAFARFAGSSYRTGHDALIKKLLATCFTLVACSTDADGEPKYGFCCTDVRVQPPVLHFVYVKSKFRKRGIARLMLGAMVDMDAEYTHHAPLGPEFTGLRDKIPEQWSFNPYPAFL